jgi:hypothetical protein
VGWRLYKHPPITTLLVGAGAAMLMRSGAKRSNRSYRDPYRDEQPRGYVPGGVAGYGYPVEEDAPGSSQGERIASAASDVRDRARQMGSRAREAAYDAGERLSEAAERARSMAHDSYESTSERLGDATATVRDRAGEAINMVRSSPAVLGLVGVAAGAAIGHALRETETGDRYIGATADVLSRGAREVGSGVLSATRRAADLGSSAASAVTATAASVADAVTSYGAEASGESGSNERKTRPAKTRRSGSAKGRVPQSPALVEAARNYPLLLAAFGLTLGTAAGLAFGRTETEDDLIGPFSDTVKRRARAAVREQYEEVLQAAEELADGLTAPSEEPRGRKGAPAADWETVIGGGAPAAGNPAGGQRP